jgi:hypothetical protein
MNICFKGQRLKDVAEIQAESQGALHSTTQWEFQRCFQQWEKNCALCINSDADYFEGDNTDM